MSGDKLTRTELAWLLTQEARSAAQKLRKGVSLTIPPPESTPAPPPVTGSDVMILPGAPPPAEDAAGVESMLNRLDETMSALASLHGQATRARRGKVDIAALIWEVAPEARVQIEMGKGLVVFGDENEFRRMLHVLMAQGGDPVASRGVEVSVKREGDEIKIAVQLGPDKSQGYETETQWLSRMAIRHGGRLTLEGDKQTLLLPANDEHREVETLRRELAAAHAQGEAYARELAAVMGTKTDPPPSVRSSLSQAPGGDAMGVLVATSRAILSDIRGVLAAIGRDIAPLRDKARWGEKGDDVAEIGASVARHVTAASEVVSDLSKLASCPLYELPSPVSVADLVRDAAEAVRPRAARREVTVDVEEVAPVTTPEGIPAFSAHAAGPSPSPSHPGADVLNAGTVSVLLQGLLNNAICASGPGTAVKVAVHETVTGVTLTVDDTGSPLSQKAKTSVPNRDFDALAQERSSTLPLIAAASIAAYLHAPLSIEDSPTGGTRARVTFPRPT